MFKNFRLPSLLPREDKFFRLLETLSSLAQGSALHLRTFVESDDAEERERAARAIRECKVEAKTISAEITKQLSLTYITPFDREDIQDFATSLYRISKFIERIRQRLVLHNMDDQKDFSRQVDLIVQEAVAMQDMVKLLTARGRHSAEIVAKVNMLLELENRGDALLGDLIASLFKEDRDVRDLILRKDIYDMLEKVIDRYRDAAGVALQIVLKHS